MGRRSSRSRRSLSEKEIPCFLKALEGDEDGLSVAAIRLLLFTGCRRSEVVSLQWEQVKLGEGRFLLRDTKNGRTRSVHLNAKGKEVLVELAERRGQEARLSGTASTCFRLGRGHGDACSTCGSRSRRREAEVENFWVHDLRHTFASVTVRSGAFLSDVQKLLGHQDIAMTQRYAHLSDVGLK